MDKICWAFFKLVSEKTGTRYRISEVLLGSWMYWLTYSPSMKKDRLVKVVVPPKLFAIKWKAYTAVPVKVAVITRSGLPG